jgi:glutamate synthase domain-containing protein 2
MMEHWGVPSLALHAKTYEYCKILNEKGVRVPDISFAGGFAREDHIFKALALGSPYAKLVCMGRAPMISGYLGSNIEGVFNPEKKQKLNGHWEELPPSVQALGKNPEEIFSSWENVKNIVGAEEMKNVPFGAIAMHGYCDKLGCGLQQFMAGARKFSLSAITRADLISANKETEAITKIPFMTESLDNAAKEILLKD